MLSPEEMSNNDNAKGVAEQTFSKAQSNNKISI